MFGSRQTEFVRKATLLTGLLIMLCVSACKQNSAESSTGAEKKGRTFGISFQTLNNPFFVDLNEGIKEVVEKHGDRLVTLDAQWNSLKQKNDVSDLVLQEAAGIFINPVNWEGVKGSLIQAKQSKIPVIVVDAPARDKDLLVSEVASDNVEAGRLAARALAEVNPKAKIAIIHLSVNKACIDRVAGFKEVVAQNPGMEILDTQEGKGTTEAARPIMRDLLGRFPQLDAVFPINDPTALGAISAIESADRLGKVTVVSVDGSQEGMAAIQSGKLYSTSAQFPQEIGQAAAQAMYDHLEGKPVAPSIAVRVKLITAKNVGEFIKH